jgi:hypothetical protein
MSKTFKNKFDSDSTEVQDFKKRIESKIEENSYLISSGYEYLRKNKIEIKEKGKLEDSENEEEKRKIVKKIFQHENFHCLRDFYCLCKHIGKDISMTIDTDNKLYENIMGYIDNDFSGYLGEDQRQKKRSNLLFKEKILAQIKMSKKDEITQDLTNIRNNIEKILKKSILDPQNRFLMLFVENEFCKGKVRKVISKFVKEKLGEEKGKVVYLRGSQLNSDNQSDSYILKFLEIIKTYIKLGYTLFMEDLDSIYPILYDFFNQKYDIKGGVKYGKITYHDKEQVFPINENFRCVIIKFKYEIENDERIQQRLPSPLLNRMEKHIIEYDDFELEDSKLIFVNVTKKFNNIIDHVKSKKRDYININDLIYCFNKNELIQSLMLDMRKDMDHEEAANDIIIRTIRFYSFKMLTLHCMVLADDKQMIEKIKEEYRRTHKFRNLKKFIEKKEEMIIEEGDINSIVSRSVVLTLSSYFLTDFSKLEG